MAKNLENMSDEEFMEAWTAASEKATDAVARTKEFAAEQRRRDAVATLEAMSPEERNLLAQYVTTEGIESQESVHNG